MQTLQSPLKNLTTTLALATCLASTGVAQTCDVRIQGNDLDGNERMGEAAYFTSDYAYSGAPGERGSNAGEILGAVYVHQRNVINDRWNQIAKVQPTSLSGRDQFGTSLDVDSLVMVAGAPNDMGALSTGPGKAYIMMDNGLGITWTQHQQLNPSDGALGDGFGSAVAIDGDFILVGAPGHDAAGQNRGAVYVYRRIAGVWIEVQKILPPASTSSTGFGGTIVLDGPLACMGGDQLSATTTSGGALGVYRLNSSQLFEELQVLQPAGVSVADFFARSAALTGDFLVVGAPNDDDVDNNAGAIYTFRYNSMARKFFQEDKLTMSQGSSSDNLGDAVATDGTTIVGGVTGLDGTGGAVAFRGGVGAWSEVRKVTPNLMTSNAGAGVAVGVNGDLVYLGDNADNSLFFGAGAAFITDISVADTDGNGVGDLCEDLGTNYCDPAVPNSTGQSASMSAIGSQFIVDQELTLETTGLPQHVFGFYLCSQTQGMVTGPGGSQGNLCLGGAIGRFNETAQIFNTASEGYGSLIVDLAALPTPTTPVAATAGQTWNFQAWYRDDNPSSTSNFSDAIAVTFQ